MTWFGVIKGKFHSSLNVLEDSFSVDPVGAWEAMLDVFATLLYVASEHGLFQFDAQHFVHPVDEHPGFYRQFFQCIEFMHLFMMRHPRRGRTPQSRRWRTAFGCAPGTGVELHSARPRLALSGLGGFDFEPVATLPTRQLVSQFREKVLAMMKTVGEVCFQKRSAGSDPTSSLGVGVAGLGVYVQPSTGIVKVLWSRKLESPPKGAPTALSELMKIVQLPDEVDGCEKCCMVEGFAGKKGSCSALVYEALKGEVGQEMEW